MNILHPWMLEEEEGVGEDLEEAVLDIGAAEVTEEVVQDITQGLMVVHHTGEAMAASLEEGPPVPVVLDLVL